MRRIMTLGIIATLDCVFCNSVEWCYGKCRYAERRAIVISVIIFSVIMTSAILLSIIYATFFMLKVIMLSSCCVTEYSLSCWVSLFQIVIVVTVVALRTQGSMLLNFLRPWVTNFRNKLECLFLASLSSLTYCLYARPGAYTRVEHLKGVSLG
jgi:hypothetical protein